MRDALIFCVLVLCTLMAVWLAYLVVEEAVSVIDDAMQHYADRIDREFKERY